MCKKNDLYRDKVIPILYIEENRSKRYVFDSKKHNVDLLQVVTCDIKVIKTFVQIITSIIFNEPKTY